MKTKYYVPGETITTEEEYLAGKNTFDDNGLIKASCLGEVVFDENQKEVSIKCNKKNALTLGDIVYGKVVLVKDKVAVLDIVKAEGDKVLPITKAQIPVRDIHEGYVTSAKKYFKIGDTVKAKVVSVSELAMDLTTKAEGLGVVIAYCGKCKEPMNFSNDKLMCLNCGNAEERKWFEKKKFESDERPPQRNFRDNRSRGRGNFKNRGRGNFRGEKR